MRQTLKWWPAQSTDGQPRWREQNITREIPRRRRTEIRKMPGSSIGEVSEEEKKKSSPAKDELWPSPQSRCRQSSSSTIPPDRWRRSHKGPVLKPASLQNSLYWACWVWVCSHLQWKEPPNRDPTYIYIYNEKLLHILEMYDFKNV